MQCRWSTSQFWEIYLFKSKQSYGCCNFCIKISFFILGECFYDSTIVITWYFNILFQNVFFESVSSFIKPGKTVQYGKQEPLIYQHRDQKYITIIDRAYSEAARTLLEVLIQENDLMGRLRSIKNYFLLAQGDFVVFFHFTYFIFGIYQ